MTTRRPLLHILLLVPLLGQGACHGGPRQAYTLPQPAKAPLDPAPRANVRAGARTARATAPADTRRSGHVTIGHGFPFQNTDSQSSGSTPGASTDQATLPTNLVLGLDPTRWLDAGIANDAFPTWPENPATRAAPSDQAARGEAGAASPPGPAAPPPQKPDSLATVAGPQA